MKKKQQQKNGIKFDRKRTEDYEIKKRFKNDPKQKKIKRMRTKFERFYKTIII